MVVDKEKSLLLETMANHSFKNKNTLLLKKRNGLEPSLSKTENKPLYTPLSHQDGVCETQMQFFKLGGGGKA